MKAKTTNLTRPDAPERADSSPSREGLTATQKLSWKKLGRYSVFAATPAILVSNLQEAWAGGAQKAESSVAGRPARLAGRLDGGRGQPALLKRQSMFRLPHQKDGFDMVAALGGGDDCPGRPVPGGQYTAAAPYTDAGDTTGANNTVGRTQGFYYTYDSVGPDHIYSFTLTDRGPNPQIQVSTTSPTYRPIIYILDGGGGGGCPAGTGNGALNLAWAWAFHSPTATIDSAWLNFLPLNVPLYLVVDSNSAGPDGAGPYTLRMQDVTIGPPPQPNPIEDPQFFVRRHYLDFLSREPEAGEPWTAILTGCPDQFNQNPLSASALCDRLAVSAAFFQSPEFSLKGFYAFRFYKVALGRLPAYTEITADMGQLSGQTADDVFARRAAFAAAFAQRQDFKALYDPMTNAQYVAALLGRYQLQQITTEDPQHPEGPTRVTLTAQQLVDALNGNALTRAQVLRAVVQSSEADGAEYQNAFVAMQYYGYLRREPEDAGYQAWLRVIRENPTNVRLMVNGFVNSQEYRRRFGPN